MKAPVLSSGMKKVFKTAGYVAVSAVLGYLLSELTNNPMMFGVYGPMINIVLVAAKKYFDSSRQDKGSEE